MDINEIEKGLGQFRANENQLLQAILNKSITNQAILENILSLQLEIMTRRDLNDPLIKKVNDRVRQRISEIQAEVVSGFDHDDE